MSDLGGDTPGLGFSFYRRACICITISSSGESLLSAVLLFLRWSDGRVLLSAYGWVPTVDWLCFRFLLDEYSSMTSCNSRWRLTL